MDIEALKPWIGRTETQTDSVTPVPLRALSATLDRDDPSPAPGDPLPPIWHWLYFLPIARASGVGPDGHPRRGGFLPPVPLPRRMFAASRLRFERPLRVGESVTRTGRILDVSMKSGRSGTLVFVRVGYEIAGPAGLALREEQDIVYREMAPPGEKPPAPAPARTDEQFSRTITPDPVLLFRYSALTFNGHRIHYDRPYAMGEEGYPGLVVHGPLIATLLLDLLRRERPGDVVRAFEFRAMSPLFDTAPFTVCGSIEGDTAALWARGPEGQLAMQASATLAVPDGKA